MDKIISVVAPAYNEEDVVRIFYERVSSIMQKIEGYDYEIVIVNDGSKDDTYNIIREICQIDKRVKLINLSRNFGHEIALTAGIDHASGDAVILMDIDLQDPPEIIPAMILKYEEGYDVVNARRISRDGETFMKKLTAKMFYRVIAKANKKINIPENVGNFRLVSKNVVVAFKKLSEHHRFTRGLISWIGYKTCFVDFHRESRIAGKSKYNWKGMINYAIEGLTSFTTVPLRISTYFGIITFFIFLVYFSVFAIFVLANKIVDYNFHFIILFIILFSSINSIFIGILGEYISRIFNETKNRPLYCIQDTLNVEE